MFNQNDYWKDVDKHLINLTSEGYVKLPSISEMNLNNASQQISEDMENSTFKELSSSHQAFLEDFGIHNFLTPKLFELAKSKFKYKGEINNQYHVGRRVEPGNSKEMYRAHFDSHLFTMVIPLKIPQSNNDNGTKGDLIYFPKARSAPRGELLNIIAKVSHKKFASLDGINEFSKNHDMHEDDFSDYCPLLFIGNTTLHTNKPVTKDSSSYRLTLLAHFFDPSPKFGIGSLLRLIRNR